MKLDINGLDKLQDNIQQAVQKGVQKGVDELNRGLDRFNENINNDNKSKNGDAANFDKCPNCSASLTILDNGIKKCQYCGAEYGSASQNINGKTVMDSVFDFVEKQQKINMENHAQKLEKERIKTEMKLKKLERKHKRNVVRRILSLAFLLALLYYCYLNQDLVSSIINSIMQNIPK